MKCPTPSDVKFHGAQCVNVDYNQREPVPVNNKSLKFSSILEVWVTFIGIQLTREPTTGTVLTKCWNRELLLATNL